MSSARPGHTTAGPLQIRGTVMERYGDVLTTAARRVHRGPGAVRPDPRRAQSGENRPARRPRRRPARRSGSSIRRPSSRAPPSRWATRARATSTARRSRPISSASGSRARARRRVRERRSSAACATSPMRCCRAPTAGCSTARTPSARCRRCRSTTSGTWRWRWPATPVFLEVAAAVAGEMNAWSTAALGRPIVDDWTAQLDFTVPLFRARGLHLDDRHVRWADGAGFSASIVDAAIYVANNLESLGGAGPAGGAVPAQDPDGGRRRAVERHPVGASSTTSAPARARSRSTCWSSSSRRATS